jgi:hypothetical protein
MAVAALSPSRRATSTLKALVHPGGETRDPCRGVRGLHRSDGAGAFAVGEVPLEQRVVVESALRLVREAADLRAP